MVTRTKLRSCEAIEVKEENLGQIRANWGKLGKIQEKGPDRFVQVEWRSLKNRL